MSDKPNKPIFMLGDSFDEELHEFLQDDLLGMISTVLLVAQQGRARKNIPNRTTEHGPQENGRSRNYLEHFVDGPTLRELNDLISGKTPCDKPEGTPLHQIFAEPDPLHTIYILVESGGPNNSARVEAALYCRVNPQRDQRVDLAIPAKDRLDYIYTFVDENQEFMFVVRETPELATVGAGSIQTQDSKPDAD